MFWENGRGSENIEDPRGVSLPGGIAGSSVGVVVIALIVMFFGVDPRLILQEAGQGQMPSGQRQSAPVDPAQDKLKDFVSVVLADTEDTWGEIFRRGATRYERPKLVLFTGAVRSACGDGALQPGARESTVGSAGGAGAMLRRDPGQPCQSLAAYPLGRAAH